MNSRFDELIATAADDGASAPSGLFTSRNRADVDQLMQAWFIERQNNIECSLILDQASRFVSCVLNDGEVTETTRRKGRHLLRVIKEARQRQRRPRGF